MKVVLTKDVQNLGGSGEIKEVSDGYARNFLIPGGFAKVATEATIRQAEELKIKKLKQAEEELVNAQELAGKLQGASVEIMGKADETGKLYAAVKQNDISKALENKGFKIEESKIIMEQSIKDVGDYEVTASLDHGLEVKIGVSVKADK